MRTLSGFSIEAFEDGRPQVRLVVCGELDLATVPAFAQAVREQQAAGREVLLDLRQLEFIDSSGMRAVSDAVKTAEVNGWKLSIDARLSRPVRRAFELIGLIAVLPLVEE